MRAINEVMSRISAIESTMAAKAAGPAPRDATPGVTQQTFQQVMNQAMGSGGVLGGERRTLGDYAGFGNSGVGPYGYGYPANPQVGWSSSGAPPGLEGYANGHIPPQALAQIPGTSESMWAPAAAAFTRMRDAAARDGIALTVVDAYRPYADQVRLANELGLYSEGGWAAQPGTSQHGWGRAVDIETDDATVAWLRANAGHFGFTETVPREPWHWEFHG